MQTLELPAGPLVATHDLAQAAITTEIAAQAATRAALGLPFVVVSTRIARQYVRGPYTRGHFFQGYITAEV